jgi:hypothetical protein
MTPYGAAYDERWRHYLERLEKAGTGVSLSPDINSSA